MSSNTDISTTSTGTTSPSHNQAAKKARLKWDEDNIALTSAERGTRQKITEPKTPYIHYDMEADTELQLVDTQYLDSQAMLSNFDDNGIGKTGLSSFQHNSALERRSVDMMLNNGVSLDEAKLNEKLKNLSSFGVSSLDRRSLGSSSDSASISFFNNGSSNETALKEEQEEEEEGSYKEKSGKGEWDSSSYDAGDSASEVQSLSQSHDDFAKKRSQHYKMSAALLLRHQQSLLDVEDEEQQLEDNDDEEMVSVDTGVEVNSMYVDKHLEDAVPKLKLSRLYNLNNKSKKITAGRKLGEETSEMDTGGEGDDEFSSSSFSVPASPFVAPANASLFNAEKRPMKPRSILKRDGSSSDSAASSELRVPTTEYFEMSTSADADDEKSPIVPITHHLQ